MKLGFAIGFTSAAIAVYLLARPEKGQVIEITKGNRDRLSLPIKYGRIH